jgi:hypothetical protein
VSRVDRQPAEARDFTVVVASDRTTAPEKYHTAALESLAFS